MRNGDDYGSFRDPSGSVFRQEGVLYRQINDCYGQDFDRLIDSGLYENLAAAGLLIPHEEASMDLAVSREAYKVIKPREIPFVSYPYEWCFSQLKSAAVLTLEIQKRALAHGMWLKDASAFNVQFLDNKPVLIDTLSFEAYPEGRPWVAYRQFCQHFFAPLALMSRKDVRLSQLFRAHLDGVPLDLASKLLGASCFLSFSLWLHVHLHSKTQKRFEDAADAVPSRRMGRQALLGLIDNMETAIEKWQWRPAGTEWGDYYEATSYTDGAFEQKRALVEGWLDKAGPETLWDLGANIGVFTRLASKKGIFAVAFDVDPAAVEKNYLTAVANGDANLLPLVLDLTNPSGGMGWANRERMGLIERGPADMALALALVHHLAISNNLPFDRIADFLRRVCDTVVIEFVPKEDPQVQKLLATREDVFPRYDEDEFRRVFANYFSIEESVCLEGSPRSLHLMKRKLA